MEMEGDEEVYLSSHIQRDRVRGRLWRNGNRAAGFVLCHAVKTVQVRSSTGMSCIRTQNAVDHKKFLVAQDPAGQVAPGEFD